MVVREMKRSSPSGVTHGRVARARTTRPRSVARAVADASEMTE